MFFRHQPIGKFISLYLSFMLAMTAFSPLAEARNPCDKFLSAAARQQARTLKAIETSKADLGKDISNQAVAAFRSLPKKLRENHRNTIFGYLLKNSPNSRTLEALVKIYREKITKWGPLDKKRVQELAESAAKTTTKETELLLRLHPALHELFILFEIPRIAEDKSKAEAQKRQIIDELKELDPFMQQITIRAALNDIIETTATEASSYSYTILLEAATDMIKAARASKSAADKSQKRILKHAQELAAGLGKLISIDNLDYDIELAKQQLYAIIMQDVEGGNLRMRQVWVALHKTFLNSDAKINNSFLLSPITKAKILTTWLGSAAIITAVAIDIYKAFTSGDFNPASHYALPNSIMTTTVLLLGIKFAFKYLGVLRQGPLLDDKVNGVASGTPRYYLQAETEKDIRLTLDSLKTNITAVMQILMPFPITNILTQAATTTQPSAPLPASTNIAAVNPDSDSTASTSAVVDAKEEPATPAIDLNTVRQLVQSTPEPVAFHPAISQDLRESGERYAKFFTEVKKRVVERDVFTDRLATALLMPKPSNILSISEPGVGKTEVTRFILNSIKDEEHKPSVFAVQMGKDTILDDLMGPVKPSEITKHDRVVRATENGLPGKRLAFFDEYFRAPLHTRESLLEFQANGSASLSGITYVSKNILSMYASNKYSNQVFLRDGKDAKAEFDRMLFTFVLSPFFESDDNMINLGNINTSDMPEFFFADILALKDFAKNIPLDRYFRSKIKLLVNRLRAKAMIAEHESEKAWQKRVQTGEIIMTSPEYNARVLSPRSEAVSQALLTRFALFDWIMAGLPESHPPEVTEKHFKQLEDYFVPISSPTEHLERVLRQYSPGSAEHQEFKQIITSRTEYQNISSTTETDIADTKAIKKLRRFAAVLQVGWDELNGLAPKRNSSIEITDENAKTVDEFLAWRNDLLKKLQERGRIIEIQPDDVALDQAAYLADRLLNYLRLPKG